MGALAAALASLALAATAPVEGSREVRWVLGPADVELGGGRLRFAVPGGVALVSGEGARTILDAVLGPARGADGADVAVVSPLASSQTWFVVVTWQAREEALAGARAPGTEAERGRVVWLERPRRDARTGRISWTFAGPTREGPMVNQHLQIPARGGAVRVTLVAPVEELSTARAALARIVAGFDDGVQAVSGDGGDSRR